MPSAEHDQASHPAGASLLRTEQIDAGSQAGEVGLHAPGASPRGAAPDGPCDPAARVEELDARRTIVRPAARDHRATTHGIRERSESQLRARVRFREFATPWFDYLIVSQEELREIVDGTGWRVRRFIDDAGPLYCAILEHQ